MSQTYSPVTAPTSRVRFLLLAVWAVLTLGALVFVFTLGTNAPYADEWEFVPVLTGNEPVRPWFWAQHNEHRWPVPRAIYYPLFRLSLDFRAGMLLQVVLLSLLSLALMKFAARLRGRPDWVDAFFPVSLLHLGHWENFIMGYQLCFVLFTLLVVGLGVVAMRTTRETAFRSGFLAGVLGLLVEGTGGSGLAVAVPVSLWLLYLAAILVKNGRKGRALVLVVFALLQLGYIALYFVGYERPPHHPPLSRDPLAVGMVTGEVLSVAIGMGVSAAWGAVLATELVLGIATLTLLFRNRTDRPATFGLFAVVLGVCGVALAIGLSRGGFGTDMGLWSRYSLLTWPLLGLAFLVWVRAGRKWVPIGMCMAAALAFPGNTLTGLVVASPIRAKYTAIEASLAEGVPARVVVDRHLKGSGQEVRAVRGIPMLREAGIGIFAVGQPLAGRNLWVTGGTLLFVGGAVFLVVRWFWHLGKAVQAERARELFRLQHERFEEQLLKAAAATGLPRGLQWVRCLITGPAVLVRDIANGGIVALVPVVVEFEPEPGSDMEDVPAAREPRSATALFTFAGGTWTASGRVVFNHDPDQLVAKFAPQFRLIHHGQH